MSAATLLALPKPPLRNEEGFVLPHNLEAERSCLAAALIQVNAADYIVDKLHVDDFFRRAHKELFLAIVALREAKRTPDLVTLRQQLGPKALEEVGGPSYISALLDGVGRSVNVANYADILRDLRGRRDLVSYANRTLDLVAAGEHGSHAILTDTDRRLMELQAGHSESRMRSVKATTGELLDNMAWRHSHKGQLIGVETGFPGINEQTFGWTPGDLIVVGARPSIGKTTFVMNSAVAAARAGKRIGIFSLEMKRQQLEYRLLSSLANVPLTRILSGYMSEADWTAVSQAVGTLSSDLSIDIDDRSGQSVYDIRASCRRLKADGGLDLVIVDYVQLMPGSLERRGASRNDEVTDISRRLKVLADEVSVPILLLSQLTRDSSKRVDPRPKLSDLRESGALEQDADLVCFLHRKNHREGGPTEFILEKQRNGPTGTVMLSLDRDTVTFRDASNDPPAEVVDPEPAKPKKERTYAQRYAGKRAQA